MSNKKTIPMNARIVAGIAAIGGIGFTGILLMTLLNEESGEPPSIGELVAISTIAIIFIAISYFIYKGKKLGLIAMGTICSITALAPFFYKESRITVVSIVIFGIAAIYSFKSLKDPFFNRTKK